ncbi:MAG: hypothetical protein JSV24_02015, partial [Bacteroidales bacterium]
GIGIGDKDLNKIKGMNKFISRGLGKKSGVKKLSDLANLSPEKITNDLNVTNIEARKIRAEMLFTALKSLDIHKIKDDVEPFNPVQARTMGKLPEKVLKMLKPQRQNIKPPSGMKKKKKE